MCDEINSNKIKIIPIKIENCEIHKILQTKKYIDFSKNYKDSLNELIEQLENMKKCKPHTSYLTKFLENFTTQCYILKEGCD